jgi:hypothetical protein
MKLLNLSETQQIAGGDLDGVSYECWKMIGLTGYLVAYNDITMTQGLAYVDAFCTDEEQDIAIQLSKAYIGQ